MTFKKMVIFAPIPSPPHPHSRAENTNENLHAASPRGQPILCQEYFLNIPLQALGHDMNIC